jgi:hypothetical protein
MNFGLTLSPTKPQLQLILDLMITEGNKQKRQGRFWVTLPSRPPRLILFVQIGKH